MSIFDQLIGVLAPHDCLGCGSEGLLLCLACQQGLIGLPERCYRCRRVSSTSLTCSACRKTSRLYRAQAVTIYADSAKALIWQLKFAGAQAAAQIMAQQMKKLIEISGPNVIIVPVPTATSRIRQRGYDQATLLARALSKQTRLPYLSCLARRGQVHQHQMTRQQRLLQLKTAFRVKRSSQIKDAHIILIDDVLTTGSTLEAAATALKAAGAYRIEAIVFAQP